MEKLTTDEKKVLTDALEKVKKHVRITKVVCTRSVKGHSGDSYVGFSAAWDSIQDDAGGPGSDLISAQDGNERPQGMTLREGRLAALVLGMQVDIAAHEHAVAGSNITSEQLQNARRSIKANYTRLMLEVLGNGNGGD